MSKRKMYFGSGGSFGAPAHAPTSTSGGLFGAPATTTTFGVPTPHNGGSFGGSGGLFGAPASSGGGGGLFGSTPPALYGVPVQGGGLFGSGFSFGAPAPTNSFGTGTAHALGSNLSVPFGSAPVARVSASAGAGAAQFGSFGSAGGGMTPAPTGVDMSSFFNNPEGSDVTLVVEGQEIPAHKIILRARSSPLYDVCGNSNRVEIQDISHQDFLKILSYIYKNQLPENMMSAATLVDWIGLLELADTFGLDGLKVLVGHEIIRITSPDNVMQVLRASVDFDAPDLKKVAAAAIASVLSSVCTPFGTADMQAGIGSLAPGDTDGKMMAAVLLECMTPR